MAEDKKKDEIAIIEINEEFMKQKLYEFRGCKVLLDADLAEVYGYELKAFNQQVKRNIERFQNDMMFQHLSPYLQDKVPYHALHFRHRQQVQHQNSRPVHLNDWSALRSHRGQKGRTHS